MIITYNTKNMMAEEKMNYTLTPSLKHIALVKISTTLWNQNCIRDLIETFFPRESERKKQWQEIENKVMESVPQLSQPELLKEEILCFIRPIGLQLLNWRQFHGENCYLGKYLPKKLFWTLQGTIHKKKTAEALIKGENLDIVRRYKLACIYCLEDDILSLWDKLPVCHRRLIYNEEDPRNFKQRDLVFFWTNYIKREEAKLNNMIQGKYSYQYAFEYAAKNGNKAATEYFLLKLIPREREESLVRSAGNVANLCCEYECEITDFPKEHYGDVLCFLLSQMNEEQKTQVFKIHHYKVLKGLLDWPWQSLFIETANRMWDFLSEKCSNYLLEKIVYKVIDGHKDYDYLKLFEEFWQKIPNAHKRYVINEWARGSYGSYISSLFKLKGEDAIKLILKDATLIEKKEIIFGRGQEICQDLIYGDKWDLLVFFIQECIMSKSDLIKFKKKFEKRITRSCSKEEFVRNKVKFDKFFQLLDDFINR